MSHAEFYFVAIAAAYVRGKLPAEALPEPLRAPLEELCEPELTEIIDIGLEAGLRLHRFKRTMGLERVARVMGALRGIAPADLLDIGSGRGAFLWPLIDSFPDLPITAIDLDARRVSDLRAVQAGGIANLTAHQMDLTALEFDEDAFDVVTVLEVLEHIKAAERAIAEAVRAARRFVVVSVPAHEDDNPEHIHLFDERRLSEMFTRAGALRVRCDYVLNHIIAIARVS